MSAAMEAAIEGVPSIGLSLLDYKYDADFTVAKMVAHDLTRRMLSQSMPEHILLNVNIPVTTPGEFKGMKVCRQAYAKWEEEFDHRVDPRGKDYYWMVGKFVNMDKEGGTDVEALKAGFASIVPIRIDFTDTSAKDWLHTNWGL